VEGNIKTAQRARKFQTQIGSFDELNINLIPNSCQLNGLD
jgi:hypothetical protein